MRYARPNDRRTGSGSIPPEVLYHLELSRQKAESTKTREMHCPMCGYLVQIIPVTQTEIVFVKCHKCKFTGALDPAYFRRVKRLSAYNEQLRKYASRKIR
ncbi:hypothetical protein HMPREF1986_00606 [Oribacterium sp. oral taxon 078 str. F0263]|uniref:hypothetical protein n=1 Tax=Oribacterium sp. oral taxon 078 TaxID=652706 RepID=UPI0003AE50FA|nr:hypothetical protein [Oribacterium sp. oral taxon 078]ERL22342.1 hypothetical protein HMPREF1986_00606 [Oribacterium sp. oral taxon 078 str. F0263]